MTKPNLIIQPYGLTIKEYEERKTAIIKQAGQKELAKDIVNTINKRKGKQSIGTLTRIYSYCNKIINEETLK